MRFFSFLKNCLRLERVIRGVNREQSTGTRPRLLPITATILRRLQELLNPLNYSVPLFWAACCTGFFGFLRCGEFTTTSPSYDPNPHLSLADVKVNITINPTVVLLRIKSSKTDQFRKGHTIRMGATHSSVCAVRAFMAYLHQRGSKPSHYLCTKLAFP